MACFYRIAHAVSTAPRVSCRERTHCTCVALRTCPCRRGAFSSAGRTPHISRGAGERGFPRKASVQVACQPVRRTRPSPEPDCLGRFIMYCCTVVLYNRTVGKIGRGEETISAPCGAAALCFLGHAGMQKPGRVGTHKQKRPQSLAINQSSGRSLCSKYNRCSLFVGILTEGSSVRQKGTRLE